MTPDPLSTIPWEKHTSLYFDDGDIEMSAVSADRETVQLYKVYRVSLSMASDAFRDTFPAGAGPLNSVITIQDSAEDFSALLLCIFDTGYVTSSP